MLESRREARMLEGAVGGGPAFSRYRVAPALDSVGALRAHLAAAETPGPAVCRMFCFDPSPAPERMLERYISFAWASGAGPSSERSLLASGSVPSLALMSYARSPAVLRVLAHRAVSGSDAAALLRNPYLPGDLGLQIASGFVVRSSGPLSEDDGLREAVGTHITPVVARLAKLLRMPCDADLFLRSAPLMLLLRTVLLAHEGAPPRRPALTVSVAVPESSPSDGRGRGCTSLPDPEGPGDPELLSFSCERMSELGFRHLLGLVADPRRSRAELDRLSSILWSCHPGRLLGLMRWQAELPDRFFAALSRVSFDPSAPGETSPPFSPARFAAALGVEQAAALLVRLQSVRVRSPAQETPKYLRAPGGLGRRPAARFLRRQSSEVRWLLAAPPGSDPDPAAARVALLLPAETLQDISASEYAVLLAAASDYDMERAESVVAAVSALEDTARLTTVAMLLCVDLTPTQRILASHLASTWELPPHELPAVARAL